MNEKDLIKNLLMGDERMKSATDESYKGLAHGIIVMVREFQDAGFDQQTSIAMAFKFVEMFVEKARER